MKNSFSIKKGVLLDKQNKGFKKRFRLLVKNIIFCILHLLAIKKLKKIAKNSKIKPFPKKNSKTIIFDTIYGMYGDLIYWEGSLAKALQLRGHKVKMLICNKTLTMCTSEYTVHRVHNDLTCKHCIEFSKEFLETTKIPYETWDKHISKDKIKEFKEKVFKFDKEQCHNYKYKEIYVGRLARNAAIRYFKGTLEVDEEYYLEVLRLELINTLIGVEVGESIYKQNKPDVLITTHPGYSSWGGFAEVFYKKGIKVCSPGKGYKDSPHLHRFARHWPEQTSRTPSSSSRSYESRRPAATNLYIPDNPSGH